MHAHRVVNKLVKIEETDAVGSEGLVDPTDGLSEVGVVDDFLDEGVLLVGLHPVVLFVAGLVVVGSEKVGLVPGAHNRLLNMDGQGVEFGAVLEDKS